MVSSDSGFLSIYKSSHNVILSEAKESQDQFWSAQKGTRPEMFESLASCFAFRCSASLNMTAVFTE